MKLAEHKWARAHARIAHRWARIMRGDPEDYYQEIELWYHKTKPKDEDINIAAHRAAAKYARWVMGRAYGRSHSHDEPLSHQASPATREAQERGGRIDEQLQAACCDWYRDCESGRATLQEIAEYGEALRQIGEAARKMRKHMLAGMRRDHLDALVEGEAEFGAMVRESVTRKDRSSDATLSWVRSELRKKYKEMTNESDEET